MFQAEAADLDGFVSRVAPLAPGPVRVDAVGAVLGSRCGPGAIGVAYQGTEPHERAKRAARAAESGA